jgi:PAS domain S-box-containing protein
MNDGDRNIADDGRVCLLAIDDKPDNLATLRALMSSLLGPCELLCASSGREGLEMARRHRPDTILLDVLMPGMDGYEVCRRLKEDESIRHIPVIFLTAVGVDSAQRAKGLELGGDAFLAKPVDPAELVAQVRAMLRLKKGEDALRRERSRLRNQVAERTEERNDLERRYEALFNSVGDAIFISDREGRLLDCNQAAEALLGLGAEEIVGKNAWELEEGLSAEQWRRRRREVESQGAAVFETVLAGPDGGKVEAEVNCRTTRLGERQACLSVVRDVTERKLLEAQLRQAQKMEAVGTLAGGIAHDFNNLLGSIMGCAELSLMKSSEHGDHARHLRQILKSTERGRKLVRQILTFSRKLEGDLKLQDLNAQVWQSLQLLERTIPKMVSLDLRLAERLPPVRGDATQLEQVVLNLAANACDAMPEGGTLGVKTEHLWIDEEFCDEHAEMSPGEYVLLSLSDTGHGMDEDTAKQVFDPFFTTKEVDKGTGLGLSVAYGIVKDHQGHIHCHSRPGRGTTFEIYLPAAEGAMEVSQGAGESRARLVGGRETILLVDDEEVIRSMGPDILRGWGYEALVAGHGVEALDIYGRRGEEIDLVILDLNMPGMGGLDCLQRLKARDPEVKVIVSSGYSVQGRERMMRSLGATAFLPKPYRMKDLVATVRRVLDGAGRPAGPEAKPAPARSDGGRDLAESG